MQDIADGVGLAAGLAMNALFVSRDPPRVVHAPPQPYGDVTLLNTTGLILHSVGPEILRDIVEDYLGLLGTSAAVYEKNGDYAAGIFSSGWCRRLDAASRSLCDTTDNREALACGRWRCHESCWKTSRQSIETREPADLECDGGIRIYAVPIVVRGETVGSINFGYGDPPRGAEQLATVSSRYGLAAGELQALAGAYESRPAFVIEVAKTRLQAAARLVASIVERQEAAAALRESERRFRSIFDQVPVSIWEEDWTTVIAAIEALRGQGVTDFAAHFDRFPEQVTALLREVRIVDVNPETMRMFGARDKADLVASLETVFGTPDTLPGFVGELVALAGGGTEYRTEMALRTVHGAPIAVLLTMTFPGPASGSGTVLVSLMEITVRRQAEDRMQEYNVELEERTRERTAALEAANRELEAFSYSVSHDLRAPLRAINGYARILIEDHAAALDADGQRALHVVRSETQRMSRLIDELLAFSRMGRTGLIEGPVDMAGLARDVWARLVAGVEHPPEIAIAALPAARGDEAMLRQVWHNLLHNALKFTRGQSGSRIEIGHRARPEWGAYYVHDNGVGFDMRFADKLFQVFQRLHAEEEFEGTGVGLALVRRIVERHGGRVWADGVPGGGATFYFTLPDTRGAV